MACEPRLKSWLIYFSITVHSLLFYLLTSLLLPFPYFPHFLRCTRWRSWLRHCAISRKVAGSIPDGVIGIFHWHNPSCRTMAPGLTQPLREISNGKVFLKYQFWMEWRSWLRHCATRQKVAGSISNGVIGIFHCHNHSGRSMALGLTQSLTEMSTVTFPGGKGGRCLGLTILPPPCADCLEIWEPQSPWTLKACPGL
jgi:hypothetical protein